MRFSIGLLMYATQFYSAKHLIPVVCLSPGAMLFDESNFSIAGSATFMDNSAEAGQGGREGS